MKTLALVAVLLLLGGCAHHRCPPLRAAWYLDESAPLPNPDAPRASSAVAATGAPPPPSSDSDSGQQKVPALFVALLNEGPAWTYSGFVVNPSNRTARAEFAGVELATGEFRLLRIDLADSACSLPVEVQTSCPGRHSRTQSLPGALPNYLRAEWITGGCTLTPQGTYR